MRSSAAHPTQHQPAYILVAGALPQGVLPFVGRRIADPKVQSTSAPSSPTQPGDPFHQRPGTIPALFFPGRAASPANPQARRLQRVASRRASAGGAGQHETNPGRLSPVVSINHLRNGGQAAADLPARRLPRWSKFGGTSSGRRSAAGTLTNVRSLFNIPQHSRPLV
jgi:hypothetical protein